MRPFSLLRVWANHPIARVVSVTAQKNTTKAAAETLHLAQVHYEIGVDDYLNVVTAEIDDLRDQLTLVVIQR